MRDAVTVQARAAVLQLLAYCRRKDWAGHDPYDILNGRLFQQLPFLDARVPRLLATQAAKRSPINLRRIFGVPETQHPKALALFLAGYLKLSRVMDVEGGPQVVECLTERLTDLRAEHWPYYCWGYSFPWQTRTALLPRGTPNLICTAFAASALLDVYDVVHDAKCLRMAVSAAEYIAKELYWEANGVAGFSYPQPGLRSNVHNANFIGAALLARIAKSTNDDRLLGPAMRVARSSAGRQRADGSWPYGETTSQGWIDHFHTGYNLCGLRDIARYAETAEFGRALERGFDFYRARLFRTDGVPKYFSNRSFPVDIHCVAQAIITLTALRELHPDNMRLARAVVEWALAHMWDPRGFFYYRVLRVCTIRTSYMRWSQAWMLLALATFLEAAGDAVKGVASTVDSDAHGRRSGVSQTPVCAVQPIGPRRLA